MKQLIVNVEDISLLSELKQAIKMLRGVGAILERDEEKECVNKDTLQAIEDAKAGRTIKCDTFEDYLDLVK